MNKNISPEFQLRDNQTRSDIVRDTSNDLIMLPVVESSKVASFRILMINMATIVTFQKIHYEF